MPRKFTRKPRKTIRRRRKPKNKLSKRLPINGFPMRNIVKHRYADQINVVYTGATGAIPHKMSANGLFKPNLTGTGHQPMGFDEQMAIYNHYHVLGAKITVRNVTTLVGSTEPALWGIHQSDGGTGTISGKSATDCMERSNCQTRIKAPNSQDAPATRSQVMTAYYSPKKVYGKGFTIPDRNLGTASANPAENWDFEIFACTIDPNSATGNQTQYFTVVIDYLVMYTERKALAQS